VLGIPNGYCFERRDRRGFGRERFRRRRDLRADDGRDVTLIASERRFHARYDQRLRCGNALRARRARDAGHRRRGKNRQHRNEDQRLRQHLLQRRIGDRRGQLGLRRVARRRELGCERDRRLHRDIARIGRIRDRDRQRVARRIVVRPPFIDTMLVAADEPQYARFTRTAAT